MPKRPWSVYEDDCLSQHWGVPPSDVALDISRRFGVRRTTRAVVERARVLGLPTPGSLTTTLAQFSASSGYARSRIRTAMGRLGIRPRKRGAQGAWYAITPKEQERILSFLATVPDGQRLTRAVQGAWGGVSHRGRRKPGRCIDCRRNDVPHFCRGRCRRCDGRWRKGLPVASLHG